MSGSDGVSRILLALCLIAFSISGQIGNWGWIVGLGLRVAASLARCAVYALLRFKAKRSTRT